MTANEWIYAVIGFARIEVALWETGWRLTRVFPPGSGRR